MSDEIINTDAPQEVVVNEAEVKAREQGWVPKDEWQGSGKWRDAEAFLDRGELFDKIDSQRRKLRDLEDNQKAFHSHLETVRKAEYQRALVALRKEKKDALIEGDPDAVIAADEKLVALQHEAKQLEQVAPVARNDEPHPDFVAWTEKNTWYTSHAGMRAFAEAIAAPLIQQRLDPQEVLKQVEAQVRKEFPNRFTNPNRSRPGAVEAPINKGGSQKESYALSDDERQVMNKLVKSGVLTKEDYIRDLKAAKGEK